MRLSALQKAAGTFSLSEGNGLEDRIRFQKTVFILQEMGMLRTRYAFEWYVFGPYSPALAKAGFEFLEGKDAPLPVASDFKQRLERFHSMLAMRRRMDEARWLELIACLAYQRRETKTKGESFTNVREHQVYFQDQEVLEAGWDALERALAAV